MKIQTKVLVTGASGFIGGRILRRLASSGVYQVEGLGRSQKCSQFEGFGKNATNTQADLCDLKGLEFDAEICIHAAGLADDRSTRIQYIRQNVQATEALLRALPRCRQFIYISSSSVYDFSDAQPKSESDARLSEKLSDYGRSKLLAEGVVGSSKIDSRWIFRPRAVYGAGDRVLLPRIQRLIRAPYMLLPGHLQYLSSLCSVELLAEAVEMAIVDARPGRHCYNVADAQHYLLREKFLDLGKEISGKELLPIEIPMGVLRFFEKKCKILGIPSSFSKQSLDYLSQHSVLNTQNFEAWMTTAKHII